MTNSTVSNNRSDGAGGGIFNAGTLTLTQSIISGNKTFFASGGGIFNDGGNLWIFDSTINSNETFENPFGGGGIVNYSSGEILITRSSIYNNTTKGNGGGITNEGKTILVNSTLSNNKADDYGGGIYLLSGNVDTYNTTILDNQANVNRDSEGDGGGIKRDSGQINLNNTILANNKRHVTDTFFYIDDCKGTLGTLSYSLLSSTYDCTFIHDHNITDPSPKIDPLMDNGGPTNTHALQSGSPAIDGGNPTGCKDEDGNLLTTDQRGYPRPFDGDENGSDVCDIGAYEDAVAFQLNVAKLGSGDGVVTSSHAGINCGTACNVILAEDSSITLRAAPSGESIFTGWGGDCTGISDCKITMDENKNVTAKFEVAKEISLPVIMR